MFSNSIEAKYFLPFAAPPVGLYVKRLTETAKLPTRKSGDAGFDFYADEDVVLNYGQVLKIKTGIAVEIPRSYYGDMRSRSSFWSKGILVTGTIDSTYRGEVIVVMGWPCSMRDETGYTPIGALDPVHIKCGDKIAQMVLERIDDNFEVREVDELTTTDRGSGGFGSTGT